MLRKGQLITPLGPTIVEQPELGEIPARGFSCVLFFVEKNTVTRGG